MALAIGLLQGFLIVLLTVSARCEEECGEGYACAHDGGAYGCQKIGAPAGSPLVCCSAGQTVADCNSTGGPLHPLPFCPSGGCPGQGCYRRPVHSLKTNSRDHVEQKMTRPIRINPLPAFEEECGPGFTCSSDGAAYGCKAIDAPRDAPMACCSAGMPYQACNDTSSPLHPLPYCPYAGATGGGCIRLSPEEELESV
eukprot:scpid84520/ scgid12819/ 